MSSLDAGTNKKQRLGRGLDSLLGSSAAPSATEPKAMAPDLDPRERVLSIEISLIKGNPKQPRRNFDPIKLRELASSIKEKGIVQPILLRPQGKGYEIVAGERRWRAAQLLGLSEVPAIVRKHDDRTTLELALIENIQRADLGPLEEADAYQRLSREYQLTQSEIANKVGKDRATVANMMRLLDLGSEVRELLKSGELTVGHAKVLLSLSDAADQVFVARAIVQKKLSVRATEKLVAQKQAEKTPKSEETTSERASSHLVQQVSEELQKKLGTKVQIEYRSGKGKVVINFYSDDELNRLVEKLKL